MMSIISLITISNFIVHCAPPNPVHTIWRFQLLPSPLPALLCLERLLLNCPRSLCPSPQSPFMLTSAPSSAARCLTIHLHPTPHHRLYWLYSVALLDAPASFSNVPKRAVKADPEQTSTTSSRRSRTSFASPNSQNLGDKDKDEIV
ncbi:hypothetical protein K469DRAFT_153475 [Zopfia rhizophila CBS 207.26]|uniref:Uncharacterized protein n=1 Tax=Zopfia rhizophila CBS 207.26 TaxID=1314779 RepID=A0A6A6E855_9PEZI|nr:hypothetical protein K469DRAFT_153475 [Zopfia rhizophila CBS 207.26]